MPPAFQTYARDFLADTAALSKAEIGAHAFLRAWQWFSGLTPIPKAPRDLARLLRMPAAQAVKLWDRIGHLWTETPDGYLADDLVGQLRERQELSETNARKGRRSAEVRRVNRTATGGQPEGNRGSTGGATAVQPEGQPRLNRGSTAEPTATPTGGQPQGQPQGNLADLQTPITTADRSKALDLGTYPDPKDQEQRRSRVAPLEDEAPGVLVKLAHGVLEDLDTQAFDPLDTAEELKRRAAKAHIRYDGDRVRKALESADVQRRRAGR